jgi:hypothetical protein
MNEMIAGTDERPAIDPCVAACRVSDCLKGSFTEESMLFMTPSECLLVWELRVGR